MVLNGKHIFLISSPGSNLPAAHCSDLRHVTLLPHLSRQLVFPVILDATLVLRRSSRWCEIITGILMHTLQKQLNKHGFQALIASSLCVVMQADAMRLGEVLVCVSVCERSLLNQRTCCCTLTTHLNKLFNCCTNERAHTSLQMVEFEGSVKKNNKKLTLSASQCCSLRFWVHVQH